MRSRRLVGTRETAITSEELYLMGDEYVEMSTQLYFGLAVLCKGAALTTKTVSGNNGLYAWRALCALYDPESRGRQRVRMQQLLQPKKPEYVSQTVEAVERWEYDIREYETSSARSWTTTSRSASSLPWPISPSRTLAT